MKTMVVKRTEGSKRNGKSGGGAHSLKEAAFTTHRAKEEFSVRTPTKQCSRGWRDPRPPDAPAA